MYEDKTLVCKDCGNEFVFTAGEQEFYASRGFENEPQRCKACRDARKNAGRGTREMFTAVCASCGKEARVPFIFAKQSLQYTGRSSRGLKGTRASLPHAAHVAVNISRVPRVAFLRASRQALQRWGSFSKPRLA